ncbi:MAG TPA: hypothetical protein VGI64_16300 [Streptosporangiaceae bacterium]
MVRILLFLLGSLTSGRPALRPAAAQQPGGQDGGLPGWPEPAAAGRTDTRSWTEAAPRSAPPAGAPPAGAPPGDHPRPRRPRRLRRWVVWTAVLTAAGLVFRRAVAAAVLTALSTVLQVVGLNVHLPHVKFGWPWQAVTSGTTSNVQLGPFVLQKIEGISRPALGQVNFNFVFTHKVSKNIGPWPCWYAATFYAVGRASATVDLNPGATWWRPVTGHYQLQVLSRPAGGRPGHVAVTMVLPQPQLPQSAHDVTVDNISSTPVAVQHSWTYPGFGCGVLVRPQFSQSVLYSVAQQIAFYRTGHVPQVTTPLVRAAENQAVTTIRDNFVQPTVNALGYNLDRFTLRWAATP